MVYPRERSLVTIDLYCVQTLFWSFTTTAQNSFPAYRYLHEVSLQKEELYLYLRVREDQGLIVKFGQYRWKQKAFQ